MSCLSEGWTWRPGSRSPRRQSRAQGGEKRGEPATTYASLAPRIVGVFSRPAPLLHHALGTRWPQPTWTLNFRRAVVGADIERGAHDDAHALSASDRRKDARRGVVLERRRRPDRAQPAV